MALDNAWPVPNESFRCRIPRRRSSISAGIGWKVCRRLLTKYASTYDGCREHRDDALTKHTKAVETILIRITCDRIGGDVPEGNSAEKIITNSMAVQRTTGWGIRHSRQQTTAHAEARTHSQVAPIPVRAQSNGWTLQPTSHKTSDRKSRRVAPSGCRTVTTPCTDPSDHTSETQGGNQAEQIRSPAGRPSADGLPQKGTSR
ncbi:hypothetical protein B0H21DRAFT_527041 [Amylocystis lapponica]|nr:hypothetical protein B0H21DRAFT_527041 [Amylocystis lapponica]